MREYDINRVEFYSKEDLAGIHMLEKADKILQKNANEYITDINDILEYYHIKKYIDNGLFLKGWTEKDVQDIKIKCEIYDKLTKEFFFKINDENFEEYYSQVLGNYIDCFWEIINSLNHYKKISKTNFQNILQKEGFLIDTILKYKGIVEHYKSVVREFLLKYKDAAEILLSIYEKQPDFNEKPKFLPSTLSIKDKEQIILNYLEQDNPNLNYLKLIERAGSSKDFKVLDKAKLKAKQLHQKQTEEFFMEDRGFSHGASLSFVNNMDKIKDYEIDKNNTLNYLYNKNFILENNDPYLLFRFFDYLFEYVDEQQRIELINKRSQIDSFERHIGVHSKNEYFISTSFHLSEMTSQMQMYGYSKLLENELEISIENIIKIVFTEIFQEKYDFPKNANFTIPTPASSFLEKIRVIAPEFESILKQYKLFVEDGNIDFELLQISSKPLKIKDIPSLNENKYIYLNEKNTEIVNCAYIFFSSQSMLTYIEPFREKEYGCFFNLLANEDVKYDDYQEFQKYSINHLIDQRFIKVDDKGFIKILNYERLYILRDLHLNEYGSFYHYPKHFQKEVLKMKEENMVFTETSLFAKPEQAYFNYILNKSEFSNSLDLRNRYSHGTQPNPEEIKKHEISYHIYLKILVLTLLKIEDDLWINKKVYPK